MIESKDINDFVSKGNLDDLYKVLYSKFKNAINYYEPEEIINEFIVKCLKQETIQKFDRSKNIKFITYMITCFRNHIISMCFNTKSQHEVSKNSIDISEFREDNFFKQEYDFSYDHDMEVFEVYLNNLYKNDVRKANPKLIFKMIKEGHNDADIARAVKVTSSNVCFIKKQMIKDLAQIS
jgi:RNA polymerase sigma factor (sigma-70 family)